jgi:hypothetical protein
VLIGHMKKPVRFLTVGFALSMLATYVVYSQLQQNRNVASSSKFLAPAQISGTNAITYHVVTQDTSSATVIAPGSKTMTPVVTISPSATGKLGHERKPLLLDTQRPRLELQPPPVPVAPSTSIKASTSKTNSAPAATQPSPKP